MIPRRPADVADFRLYLLDEWKVGQVFGTCADARAAVEGKPTFNPLAEVLALQDATLWWVNADMVTLIAEAAPKMPPTTLTAELPPAPFGLVCLAKPLLGVDVNLEGTVSVDALLWSCLNDSSLGPGVNISTYGRPRNPQTLEQMATAFAIMGVKLDKVKALWQPLGSTFWQAGTDTDEPNVERADINASNEEDRRWLTTLWLLASQPLAGVTRERMDRKSLRRSARGGVDEKVANEVRIVDVRRTPASRRDGEAEGSGREYTHRWIVGADTGGFWRQQVYGPGRAFRKPTWIMPYVAGPEDKPLVLKDTVRVVRGPAE